MAGWELCPGDHGIVLPGRRKPKLPLPFPPSPFPGSPSPLFLPCPRPTISPHLCITSCQAAYGERLAEKEVSNDKWKKVNPDPCICLSKTTSKLEWNLTWVFLPGWCTGRECFPWRGVSVSVQTPRGLWSPLRLHPAWWTTRGCCPHYSNRINRLVFIGAINKTNWWEAGWMCVFTHGVICWHKGAGEAGGRSRFRESATFLTLDTPDMASGLPRLSSPNLTVHCQVCWG